MKKLFVFVALVSFSMSFGQVEMLSKTRFIKSNEKIPVTSDNAFNMITGERFHQDELNKLIKEHPDIYVEREFDKYGKFIRFWFHPNRRMGAPSTIGRTPTGEKFPEFVFKTTDEKTIDSSDLKGKWIIIRFEGHPEDFMFKAHEIMDLDEKISSFEKTGKKVVAFDVFNWDAIRSKQIFTVSNSRFHIVSNGQNFTEKFKIHRNPLTLVINPNGILMGYYKFSEDIDLFALSKD
ncbi:redoxin domain-containing protein [Flagellimonas sp.]|uniref:redoxin domain-containing protein n=1 Tax=Flagellimonas sp. TaxID=2058762 RepID=UPI003B511C8C